MSAPVRRIDPPRLTVSFAEAAAMLGGGLTWFRAVVLPTLPIVDGDGKKLVDVEDLRQWVKDHKGIASGNQPDRARRTPSGSGSTGVVASSPREQAIERELTEKLADSTRKSSQAGASVHVLKTSPSPRKSRQRG